MSPGTGAVGMLLAFRRCQRCDVRSRLAAVFAGINALFTAFVQRVASLAGSVGMPLAGGTRQTPHTPRLVPAILAAIPSRSFPRGHCADRKRGQRRPKNDLPCLRPFHVFHALFFLSVRLPEKRVVRESITFLSQLRARGICPVRNVKRNTHAPCVPSGTSHRKEDPAIRGW